MVDIGAGEPVPIVTVAKHADEGDRVVSKSSHPSCRRGHNTDGLSAHNAALQAAAGFGSMVEIRQAMPIVTPVAEAIQSNVIRALAVVLPDSLIVRRSLHTHNHTCSCVCARARACVCVCVCVCARVSAKSATHIADSSPPTPKTSSSNATWCGCNAVFMTHPHAATAATIYKSSERGDLQFAPVARTA
jgi:hypothetical protein